MSPLIHPQLWLNGHWAATASLGFVRFGHSSICLRCGVPLYGLTKGFAPQAPPGSRRSAGLHCQTAIGLACSAPLSKEDADQASPRPFASGERMASPSKPC
jgi:hypothetical protein